MALRSYLDAIESDPNARVVVTAPKLDVTMMPLDEDIYVAWDDGAGFYAPIAAKDVHVESDGDITTATTSALYQVFGLSDLLAANSQARAGNYIACFYNVLGSGVKRIDTREWAVGVLKDSTFIVFDYENTPLWHEFKIDWTALTLTVTFYTNALRTITAFVPEVISLTIATAMQYMYGIQGFNAGGAGLGITGFTQNFNQIAPALPSAAVGGETGSLGWLVQRRLQEIR